MNSRRRNLSEDPQIIRSIDNADELLLKIPIDLIIEILSRLPLKSIARCRCVSKLWASVLRRPDFTELFLTRSLARPQLLFACRNKGKNEEIFSTPQPQNHHHDSSPIATINHHVSFPLEHFYEISSPPVNGFVCISDARMLKGRKTPELVCVIYNPSTRQSFTLPKIKKKKRTMVRSFLLAYDPIEKQHKVLALISQDVIVVDHQVLTITGTGNLTWRLTECGIPHSFPRRECVCISGVMYYTARDSSLDEMIVCFDVRSEKYSFVKFMERGMLPATLINFQGKLASLRSSEAYLLSETSASLEMWILEDAEKHEWSHRIFNIPPMWKDTAIGKCLSFEGVTATNEFVFTTFRPSDAFHVYYYNFDKEAITRVEIQGMGGHSGVRTFMNHVEDVKLM